MQLTEKQLEYWSKNLRITGVLLFLWFLVTFVTGYYSARYMNNLDRAYDVHEGEDE